MSSAATSGSVVVGKSVVVEATVCVVSVVSVAVVIVATVSGSTSGFFGFFGQPSASRASTRINETVKDVRRMPRVYSLHGSGASYLRSRASYHWAFRRPQKPPTLLVERRDSHAFS